MLIWPIQTTNDFIANAEVCGGTVGYGLDDTCIVEAWSSGLRVEEVADDRSKGHFVVGRVERGSMAGVLLVRCVWASSCSAMCGDAHSDEDAAGLFGGAIQGRFKARYGVQYEVRFEGAVAGCILPGTHCRHVA